MRTPLAALAVIFFAAHLAFLSPTLEDIDSINFALGVRDFDVAQHQPHPPGSPVFVALGKMTTAVFRAAGVPGAESRALAIWSVLSGALLLPLVFALFAAMDGDRRRAFWTAVVAALAPLAWFTAARPMTDTTGVALAVASLALIVRAWTGRGGSGALILGAFIAGVAAGVRIQTAALTVPALLCAAVLPRLVTPDSGTIVHAPPTVRTRLIALAAGLAGALVWAIPLVVVSGGPANYLVALQSQAGEDFEWVRMLWKSPTDPRVAFHAFVNSFAWPWGWLPLGAVVVALSVPGLLWTAWRAPRTLLLFVIAFAPYTVFHLLFQETTTTRYALPLVIPMAYLVVRAADAIRLSPFVEIAIVAASLVFAVPQATTFGNGSPAFAAMAAAFEAGGVVSGHASTRRLWEWLDDGSDRSRFLRAPHGFEWLTLVDHWQQNPGAPAQFVANPKRTDHLALFDPESRTEVVEYSWGFPEWPLLGGARPGAVTRVLFAPPGWMLDRGWAITAEVAGITEKEGYGPHRRPSIAWVRARPDAMTLALGGRHLGAPGDPDATIVLEANGRILDTFPIMPGFFFRTMAVPAGTFTGVGYLPLQVTARSTGDRPVRVGLEQFNLQPAGVVMSGLVEGWQEPEYNRANGRAWRWISERAVTWVRPIGRDVTVTLHGESPLRYYDSAPKLRATVGGRELATLSPATDFTWEFVVPSAALEAAEGRVVIESDKWFVPGDRDGTADRRHLVTRIYRYEVR